MENNYSHVLCIIGAGGHGKVVADAALRQGIYNNVCFVDERVGVIPGPLGLSIVGNDSQIPNLIHSDASFIVAIGDNKLRADKFNTLVKLSAKLATVVHPSAVVSDGVGIGRGTVVLAGAIINADSTVGENVIVNSGAIIEHDCQISEHCHMAPRSVMTGGGSIGSGGLFGVNACTIPGVSIGKNSIVGAGAVVITDIPENQVAVGVPARW